MASSSSKTAGFSTGFILGALITLGFFGLGYSLNLSLFLGVISSICGYCLGSWWQIDKLPSSPKKSPLEPLGKGFTEILIKTKLIKPDAKTSKRPTRPLSVFEWVLRQHKTPPKSRR
ncbi:hypothetical protein VB834_03410 [Limnoraphis robusta Tam1]|jgi:hypothetical protein|uniref:Uncharacterized protein n=2 Tax=Limnoraphis robusta TaxID=1118279 RepID=A0A0F5Y965_9CYAN|nr:hypothetical protein [Limnoraphis robusta]MCG5060989.1 hypothetical protein [Limnoraphis sp. WC205]KKD35303.1 hypothetical protein WN50_26110 [Limnoraphis robusta CS-951]MEA5497707.1 hypothetical protein [Limnoraphis robusta BA-68 BA1]MEA5519314.1 hypothetical protein [Limnoraphis robusta CCNP1315]MEA5538075.1 hypothetical protein [Limnoraphis robusta Tam1]